MNYIIYDVSVTLIFIVWVLSVIVVISKKVYNYAISKNFDETSARYLSRKTIHILAGGIIAVFVPFVYREPVTPFILSLILTFLLLYNRRHKKMMAWFQETSNFYEVDFTIMWGVSILVGWFFDRNLWLGVLPAIYMSIGDGITGIVRTLVSKKRYKGVEGSIAMLASIIPFSLIMGYGGMIAAIAGTFAEKQKFIDDNIAVPLISLLILILFKLFYPQLLKGFY